MDVTLKDFYPINNWEIDLNGETYNGVETPKGTSPLFMNENTPLKSKGQPKYLIDKTTDRRYFNESRAVVRFKCFGLSIVTPIICPVIGVINVVYRVCNLIILSHFWREKEGETKYSFTARLADAGEDLLRILATPFSIVGLELAAIYGCFNPYDGRKLYASIERATFGYSFLAPCFQPDPKSHLFGGDVNKRDAF